MRQLIIAVFVLLLVGAMVADPGVAGKKPKKDKKGTITPVPCLDPRGCPDLVVDSLRQVQGSEQNQVFSEDHCAVQEGAVEPGSRTLKRFAFVTPNIGAGSLVVGNPANHPEWFVWHSCHNHFHFKEYADYRLWTVEGFRAWDDYRESHPNDTAKQAFAAHPEFLEDFVSGNKQGFCMIDVVLATPTRYGAAIPPDPFTFFSCDDQGLSRGWADAYGPSLDGQWIDVTNVPQGLYVLESEVNAERLITESNYANNRGWIPVTVKTVSQPPLPTIFTNPTVPPVPTTP